MAYLDGTHDPALRSFVDSANGHADFPIQNLPFGVFAPAAGGAPRGGVAIGDMILDLAAVHDAGVLSGASETAVEAAVGETLNAFLALGSAPRQALRRDLSALLALDSRARDRMRHCLRDAAECTLHLPASIGDYTDFYVGIHHATNVGKLFRPDSPLMPNYKFVPIGYHGRASTVVPSGTPIRRPNGQTKAADKALPEFGPSQRLDYELELGVWIGPGNTRGEPVSIGDAADRIAGYALLNDWSARDIQAWEYQPLGPFLSKSFGTTISPWIVTPEALVPFRIAQPARPQGDPDPLPYLFDAKDQAAGALDVQLDVFLLTPGLRDRDLPPHRLSASNTRHMYWTPAQLVAHHTCNGCHLRPGDLLGTGTISAPDETGFGSMLETTKGGKDSVRLASGEERTFLADGDEVIIRARARREGFISIGFGECRGTITGARL